MKTVYAGMFALAMVIGSVAATEITFETLNAEATGIKAAMEAWKADELKRQGGEFKGHGWWPWGLRAFDYDKDGDLDLIASHHGTPGSMILKNQLKETGKLTFVDITPELDIDKRQLPTADDRPWIWDFDGDGYLDLGAISDESRKAMIWNRGGKKFEVDPGAFNFHISHPHAVTDLNSDGHPDLDAGGKQYLYDPAAKSFKTTQSPLYPEPDNLPEDVKGLEARLKKSTKNNRFLRVKFQPYFMNGYDSEGYSPRPVDLNHDGINDAILQGQGGYGGDYLGRYILGTKDGGWEHRTAELGLPESGCPIHYDDLTGDGRRDLLIVGKATGGLYMATEKGSFTFAENSMTEFLRARGPYLLRAFRGDFDYDGDDDLVLSNPRYGKVQIHQNLGEGKFKLLQQAGGWDSNPIVVCDIDLDGLCDVVVGGPGGHQSTDITIFRNTTKGAGHYAKLSPRMDAPNPYAVDAVVSVFRAGEMGADDAKPLRVVKANWDGTPIIAGLGEATNFDVRVAFPKGKTVEHKNVKADAHYLLHADESIQEIK